MRRVVAVIVAPCLLTGCEGRVVTDPLAAVTVYGQVSRPDGAGASGVSVLVEQRNVTCADPGLRVDSLVTDAAGRYGTLLARFGTQYTICVRVRASPPAGSGLAADTVERAPVEMRSRNPDSLRVDFLLQPAA